MLLYALFRYNQLILSRLYRLMKFAAMTVRDAQYAVFTLGYSREQLLNNCPKAPEGPEPDPSIRRLKAVATHPIGKFVAFDLIWLLVERIMQYM